MTDTAADFQPRARHAQWLAETIRLAESRWGPYEDGEIVRRLRHADLAPEDALIARNVALAQREHLDDVARRWRDYAWLLALFAGLVAVLSGAGAAAAALGDGSRPVNLFWALGGLLGLHALTFVLWLIGLLWRGRLGSLVARVVVGAASRLARVPPLTAAGARLDGSRPAAAALLPPALVGLLGRAGLLRAGVGTLTHAWWLLALVSALVTLIAMLATRRYGFVWETTLLAPDTFVGLTQALGRLPAWLGFAVPDAATVRASGATLPLDAPAQMLWSNWLLGCLIAWGVLPRLVALLVCGALVIARRTRVRMDTDDPSFAVLRERLQPDSERLGVADAAPVELAGATGAASAYAGAADADILEPALRARLAAPGARVMAGIELPGPAALPQDADDAIVDAGVIDGRPLRNALLEAFAAHAPERLLVVCHAPHTPDRGTVRLAGELARSARAARVWLSGDASPARLEQWRSRLAEAGVGADDVLTDGAEAGAWLGATEPAGARA